MVAEAEDSRAMYCNGMSSRTILRYLLHFYRFAATKKKQKKHWECIKSFSVKNMAIASMGEIENWRSYAAQTAPLQFEGARLNLKTGQLYL